MYIPSVKNSTKGCCKNIHNCNNANGFTAQRSNYEWHEITYPFVFDPLITILSGFNRWLYKKKVSSSATRCMLH